MPPFSLVAGEYNISLQLGSTDIGGQPIIPRSAYVLGSSGTPYLLQVYPTVLAVTPAAGSIGGVGGAGGGREGTVGYLGVCRLDAAASCWP